MKLLTGLQADIFDTPWWKLYTGRELSGGFRPGIFFISLFDWQFPLSFGSRKLLREAQASPPVLRGCLEGNVRDSRDASPLADVNITVYSGAYTPGAPVYTSGTTDPAGGYQLPIQAGEDYSVRFARTGYLDVILNGIAIRNSIATRREGS